jgi:hypothetical protein
MAEAAEIQASQALCEKCGHGSSLLDLVSKDTNKGTAHGGAANRLDLEPMRQAWRGFAATA